MVMIPATRSDLGDWIICLAVSVLALALFYALSRFQPWVTADTQGYFDAAIAADPWSQMRHPLFGRLIRIAGFDPGGAQSSLLIAGSVGLYLATAVSLYASLRSFGLTRAAAGAVLVSIVFGNLPLIWHNGVHPELPAVAALLAALSTLLLMIVRAISLPGLLLYALLLGVAIILRPSFLPAIVVFAALYIVLVRLKRRVLRVAAVAALVLAGSSVFLINSAYRAVAVGDFNIVSFGGFNMSAMAGLMLTPAIVERLPERSRDLGGRILAIRTSQEAAGAVMPTPLNSHGIRSFASAAVGYFDVYARTYDILLWDGIRNLQGQTPWVQFNAQLMRFSIDTIRAAPLDYIAWIIGATSRTVGRMVVTNLPFDLAGLGLAAITLVVAWRGRWPRMTAANALDWPVLIAVTAAWCLSAGSLMVLVTFPASRYIDTTGLLLPSLVIYPLLRMSVAVGGRTDAGRPPRV